MTTPGQWNPSALVEICFELTILFFLIHKSILLSTCPEFPELTMSPAHLPHLSEVPGEAFPAMVRSKLGEVGAGGLSCEHEAFGPAPTVLIE